MMVTLIKIGICMGFYTVAVSAFSTRHSYYLLHDDTHDDGGLKTGTDFSQSETNFHPLEDFSAFDSTKSSMSSLSSGSRQLQPSQLSLQDQGYEQQQQKQQGELKPRLTPPPLLPQRQQLLQYHQPNHPNHRKERQSQGADEDVNRNRRSIDNERGQRYSTTLKDLLRDDDEPSQYDTKTAKYLPRLSLAQHTSNNIDGGENNYGNYEDIDELYKQDMPEGNYNIHDWGGNDLEGSSFQPLKQQQQNVDKYWQIFKDSKANGDLNDGQKRNAFQAFKRKQSRKRRAQKQSQFIPGISVGAMTNLGDFFDNLKTNLEFLEKEELTDDQLQLLDGQHPLSSLKKEIAGSATSTEADSSWHNSGPHGTAAFIHAIRTYRPSHRIRNLISSVPDEHRGSNSFDPNYKWIGLGK